MSIALRGPAVLPAAGLLLLAAACGGGSLPAGWDEFSAGPYSGAVDGDWLYTYLTLDGEADGNLPGETAASVSQVTQRFFQQGGAQSVLFVFLDEGPEFATNVNIVPCEPAERVDVVSDTDELIAYYGAFEYGATVVGEVTYNGETSDLLSIQLGSEADTYQAYIKTDDCYQAATLTTRPGDDGQIEAFKEFLSRLEIDPSTLVVPTPEGPTPTPQATQ